MDLKAIYGMFRTGDTAKVGASYLVDAYNRGRAGMMRPGKKFEPSDTAWRAGGDAEKAGDPNPFPKSGSRPRALPPRSGVSPKP
mgnify:CR=1 FL=1